MLGTLQKTPSVQGIAGRIPALCLLLSFAAVQGLAARTQTEQSPRLPDEFSVVHLATDWSSQAAADERGSGNLVFEALGRRFELDLRQDRLFSPGARVVWKGGPGLELREPPRGSYLRGTVRGEPGSDVRLRIQDGSVEGFILSDGEGYLLESAAPYFPGAAPEDTLIHRLSDGPTAWQNHECGLDGLGPGPVEGKLTDDRGLHAGESSPKPGALKEVELRLFLDSFYSRRHGLGSAERAHSLVHQVNAVFEKEFGVTLRIAETVVSLDPSLDIVSGSTDPSVLIKEMGNSKPLNGADLAHLFTARDLRGSILGVAWMGVVCNPEYGVGLSQDLDNAKARFLTTAHELAHGLGARHDGSGYCRSEPQGWIMWPQLDEQASSFSGCSRRLVELNLPRFACVSEFDPEAPLPAPHPISPAGVSSQRVRFEWDPVDGAQGYALEVVDEDTLETVLDGSVEETSVQPTSPFIIGHRYRWRVGTLRHDTVTARTEWQSFTVTGWRRVPGR